MFAEIIDSSLFGMLQTGTALPPRLYEILNSAIAATAFVALVICIRYLFIAYLQLRLALSPLEALRELRKFRLAIGFTILLSGEMPRMTWVWLARYLENTGRPMQWMGHAPWVLIAIVTSGVTVLGMACVVRALVPEVWGKFGYWVAIGSAVIAVVLTQIFR